MAWTQGRAPWAVARSLARPPVQGRRLRAAAVLLTTGEEERLSRRSLGYSGFRKPTTRVWSRSKLYVRRSRHARPGAISRRSPSRRATSPASRGGRLVFSGVSFRVGAGGHPGGDRPERLGQIEPAAAPRRAPPAAGGNASHSRGAARTMPCIALSRPCRCAEAGADAARDAALLGDALSAAGGARAIRFRRGARRVGLGHALDLPVGVLSAGQRRRAGLARLLVAPRRSGCSTSPTRRSTATARRCSAR